VGPLQAILVGSPARLRYSTGYPSCAVLRSGRWALPHFNPNDKGVR
jgi:hypothetical protein